MYFIGKRNYCLVTKEFVQSIILMVNVTVTVFRVENNYTCVN